MASLIHFTLADPKWVLPDRNTIPHDVPFFQRLRHLLVDVCHRRGALAIGGMTALYPSREDAELNARALAVLESDKRNEAACLMDGAWTGHPDQNAIAVAASVATAVAIINMIVVATSNDASPTLATCRAPILIILGYRTRVAALVVVFDILMAIFLVLRQQIFVVKEMGGGWAIEIEAFLILASLAIAFMGGGRFSLTRGKGTWD